MHYDSVLIQFWTMMLFSAGTKLNLFYPLVSATFIFAAAETLKKYVPHNKHPKVQGVFEWMPSEPVQDQFEKTHQKALWKRILS